VEGVIVREYEKGGTAASIKSAVDRAIDEMQNQGDKHKSKIDETLQRAAEKFKTKMD
jgi:ribosome-associated translation inhibitor RaiA